MGVGAICTALVGLGSDPALTAAIILATAGVIGQVSFWIALRYRRRLLFHRSAPLQWR